MPRTLQKVFGRWWWVGGWVVVVVDSEFSVLLLSKALVLDLDQAEQLAILKMFNLVKERQEYPEILKASNISSFWKQKGAKDDINNERGVFLVVKLRTILDKLIYNDKYDIIDKNMGNSNIGGRKGRNIRDHLFVVNAVLNDVNKSKKEDIDIQIYDVKKCFDKLWFSETSNNIFDA